MSNYESFGKYILLEKIAAGGMAEVYLAKSAGANGVNKFVAIKRILPQLSKNDDFINMFKDEAKVAVNLNHSNIVSIYDFGMEKGQFFIVMEFVDGKNLRQIINELKKANRSITIEQAVYIAKEAAAGLDHAHRCVDQHTGRPLNITHRDMSPQNIMISFEGEAKVIDFGIAKKTENQGDNTRTGTLKGKFAYMSPEQAEGQEVDPRTDIFALGIILWELLANDRLFTGSNEAAILRKVRDCQVPPIRKINPLVPVELERIVMKALAKDKNVRYQTAANLQKDLNRFLNTQYPDFSSHDFSRFIIDCFKASYAEFREKLVAYSKIEIEKVKEPEIKKPAPQPQIVDTVVPVATPTEAQKGPRPQFPPTPDLQSRKVQSENSEPENEVNPYLVNDSQSKVELEGLKEAMAGFSKKNQMYSQAAGKITSRQGGVVQGGTRVTHISQISKHKSNRLDFSDILGKFMVLALMGGVGYWGYLVYTKKIQQQAIMNSAPSVGSDQAAAPLKNTKPNLSNDGSAINQQAPVGTTPDNNPATTNAGSTTNPIATDSSAATNQGQIDMSAKASIKISVSSQPAGAGIWIDGKDSGFTTPAVVTVTPNVETNLQLKKDGYFVYETKKIFKETTNFNTALQVAPRVAYLNIDVKNSNGNAVIYVNGQKVNESLPVKKYPVPADTDIVIMAYNPLNKQRDEAKIRLPASKEQNIELVLGRQGTSATNSVNKK